MFVKDNYLITNNSRDDSIPKEKGICDLSIPGLKGSWTTYIGDFGVNDLHGRLAFAYKYFKRLRIVDPSNMVQRETIFDSQNLSKGQNDIQTLEPTNITHFWGMSPGETISGCFTADGLPLMCNATTGATTSIFMLKSMTGTEIL